jgi:Fe2+ transport system protein FeoA
MPADPVSSLRGTVNQRSQCRYGPSKEHLYKTGFKPDAPVNIIGRDADGDWLQIELGGGNTPCWINASTVQVEGDIMTLPDTYPIDRRSPISDAFPQIGLISASPSANGITASWVHFEIREDLKQTDTVEYVIEVWTCVDGKPAFYAVGTNDTVAIFQIDNSCGYASYAHLIGQDEHGFSFPTKIPLP